jgi:hypothetical protein
VTGQREAVAIKDNPFLTEKLSIGRPDIKPEKASYAPVAKAIQPARMPPQQVSRIKVNEIKQARPLVKEQNQSVINKGQRVKPLVVKAVEQPKSPAEKVQERKQTQLEKAKTEKAVESPKAKPKERVEKPVAAPAKVPESRDEIKGGKQTVTEKKESKEEKKATKEGLEGKGKSGESREEKIERR